MKAAIGSVVVAAAVLVAGQVPMHAAPQSASTTTASKSTDSNLDSKIEKKLRDSSLKKYDIKVSVNDGVATLTGTVPTEGDRRKAAELATMNGITRVDNQLVVDLDAGRTAKGTTGKLEKGADKTEGAVDKGAEKTKKGVDKAIDKSADGISKATEKTKEGAETAWEKSKDGAAVAADKSAEGAQKAGAGISKAGEAITDTFIKARVKSKFIDEDLLKGSDISVDVNDHVVTLSGTVPTAAGRARAIEEAKKVDGVHQVIDRMTIGPKREK